MAMEAFEVFGTVSLVGGTKVMNEVLAIGKAAQTGLTPALLKGASAVGILGLAVAGFAAKSAMDFGKANRIIQQETGATGRELQALGGSFRKVFTQVPEDVEATVRTMDLLHQRTGLMGKQLEDLTVQYLGLARMQGGEANELADSASRAFGNWQIATEDQSESLDLLFRMSQKSAVPVSQLLELTRSLGPAARALGMDFEQTAAMIAQFEANGISANKLSMAFRTTIKQFTKDGVTDAAAEFPKLIQRIKDAKSPIEADGIALKYFSRSGLEMSAAIRAGKIDVADFIKTLDGAPGAISDTALATMTFGEKLGVIGHEAEAELEPLGETILQLRGPFLEALRGGVEIIGQFTDAFKRLDPATKQTVVNLGLLSLTALALAPKIASAIKGLIAMKAALIAFQGSGAAAEIGFVATNLTSVSASAVTAGGAMGTAATGAVALAGIVGYGLTTAFINLVPGVKDALESFGEFIAQSPAVIEALGGVNEGLTGNTRLAQLNAEATKTGNWAAYDAEVARLKQANAAKAAVDPTLKLTDAERQVADATGDANSQFQAQDYVLSGSMGGAEARAQAILAVRDAEDAYAEAKKKGRTSPEAVAAEIALIKARGQLKNVNEALVAEYAALTPAQVLAGVKAGYLSREQGNLALKMQGSGKQIDKVRGKLKLVPSKVKTDVKVNVNDSALDRMLAKIKKMGISVPDFERYIGDISSATGGVFGGQYSPPMLRLFGEDGPEAIVPLSPRYRSDAMKVLPTITEALGLSGSAVSGGKVGAQQVSQAPIGDLVVELFVDLGDRVERVTRRVSSDEIRQGRVKTRLAVKGA